MKADPVYWYKQQKLKQVSAFLTASEKDQLKQLAKKQEKSLTRYITKVLQLHIKEQQS